MQRKLFLTKEQLVNLYHVDKLTQKQIAQKYNVSRSSVDRLLKKYNLQPLEDWERRYPKELTSIQKEVLMGSSLGDDCIYHFESANYSYLMVGHALSLRDYAQLKFDIWKPFIRQPELRKTVRKDGKTDFVFSTGGHPTFEGLRNKLYERRMDEKDGKIKWFKKVTIEHLNQLTPVSLAFWFQDDGSRCKNGGLALHTNCFLLHEVELICKWFKDNLQIICWPQLRKENQWVVFFSSKTTEKFAAIILPWVMPLMRYKLAGVIKNPQRLYDSPFLSTSLVA